MIRHFRTLVVAFALAGGSAHAAIIDVPADQPTIGAAVAAASNGDTIRLAKGRHQDAVVTSKSLKFVGKDGAIWDGFFGGSHHDHLIATANGVTLRNIEFQNGELPVKVVGDDTVVTRCRFRATARGVVVTGARTEVSRNVFELLRDSYTVIDLAGPGARVERNVMLACYYAGIFIDAKSLGTATVANNLMQSPGEELYIEVMNATAPRIVGNRLRDGYQSGDCISAVNCDDAFISDNRIENVNYAVEHGIFVSGARARIQDNSLDGVLMYSADMVAIGVTGADARIVNNRIKNCGSGEDYDTYGIDVLGANARIEHNAITQLGGGGNRTYGIHVAGNDCAIVSNALDHFCDEYTFGVRVEGQRAAVVRNRISTLMYGAMCQVTGDDFTISRNTIRDGAYSTDPVITIGNATAPGNAVIERNVISNAGEDGIDQTGNGVVVRRNRIRGVNGYGIDSLGTNVRIESNVVTSVKEDAFYVVGAGTVVTRCVAIRAGHDGFDLSGAGLVFDGCRAIDCVAEGFDNGGGTATVVTNCTFRRSRIDYAGSNDIANDAGTVFSTGGKTTEPEID